MYDYNNTSYLNSLNVPKEVMSENNLSSNIKTITLSQDESERVWDPWKNSVIIKLIDKRIAHQYLKAENPSSLAATRKFFNHWSRSDFFTVKLADEDNALMSSKMARGSLMVISYQFKDGFLISTQKNPN